MSTPFDRWAQGPQGSQGNQPNQSGGFDNWNQAVGAAPPQQFQRAVSQAAQQVNPQDYYQHTQPGVSGTDPIGQLPQQQRGGLAQSLLGALFGSGVSEQQVQQVVGSNINPNNMSPQQLAALAQWMQQNHPEALGQVAAQNKDNPDILQSLLGNKLLMLAVAGLGAKYLADRGKQG
ncbi:MAG: hypothetical protein U0822_16405 [Anaerolineae bacterium]